MTPGRWLGRLGPDPRLRAQGLVAFADAFRVDGELVNVDPRSEVLRLGPAGAGLYLKRFRYPATLAGFLRLGAPSHCRREAENLDFLATLGVGVPAVLGWGEERRLGRPRRAFLVTAALEGARSLERILEDGAADGGRRRAIAMELAGQVARMHEAGYLDRDLKFRNVMVAADGRLHHLDSPKGRRFGRALDLRHAAIDLGMLLKHAPRFFGAREILRFLAVYAAARGLDRAVRRRLATKAAARARELHRRGSRSGR